MTNKLHQLKRELMNADRLLPISYGSVQECIQKHRAEILKEIEAIEIPFKTELQICDRLDDEEGF